MLFASGFADGIIFSGDWSHPCYTDIDSPTAGSFVWLVQQAVLLLGPQEGVAPSGKY